MRQSINTLFAFTNALEELCKRELQTRSVSIRRSKETPRVKMSQIQGAYTDEDGFTYSESIDVKVENWSNSFYTFRLDDGRFVREGTLLDSNGISSFELLKRMLREFKAWLDRCELHEEAIKNNALIYNDQLVQCENVDRRYFHSGSDGLRPVFEIVTQEGQASTWFGYSPENALENASPWLKGQPVSIRLAYFKNDVGERICIPTNQD